MYRSFLAYRYLFSRIITFASLVVVAASVALLLIIISVMEGFQSGLQARIRGTSAALKVESKHYIGLRNPAQVADIVAGVKDVRATAPYVETLALFRPEGRAGEDYLDDRLLRVIDLERELSVGDLERYVAAVDAPLTYLPRDVRVLFSREWAAKLCRAREIEGETLPSIVVGQEALRREHILPGSIVYLTGYSPVTNLPRTKRFIVAGYFKTGLYELDSRGILMDWSSGDEFLGLRTEEGVPLASGVRAAVAPDFEDEEGLKAIRSRVQEAVERAGVLFTRTLTWREERAALIQAVRVEKAIMSLIIGMVVLFSGFMIFIILTLQVVEKTRDLGVLQSMGATSGGIVALYVSIGMTLCTFGATLGAAYGVTFCWGVNTIQRWIKLLTGYEVFPSTVYYLDTIPVRFQPWDLVFIIVPTLVVGLIASLVPALRAARNDPVVALRYE